MNKDFFVKEKPVFTGIARGVGGFGYGAAQAVSEDSGDTSGAQLFTVASSTFGTADYAIIDSLKNQSDGVIVSGRYHSAKLTKDGTGRLSATSYCRQHSANANTFPDLYNNDLVSVCETSTGGSMNVTNGNFSNFNRVSGGVGYIYQQIWGRGGTYYTSGSGWLDGSSGDFKAYWMHSTQTTFDSFSDGAGGNSNFQYISCVTNGGTDYFCGIDNGSNSEDRKLLLVTGPTTSQDVKHNVNFTRTAPVTGWYPAKWGNNFGSWKGTGVNAYCTATDSYMFAPAIGVVRLSGSNIADREGGNFSNHVVTGMGDFDSSNYLICLTGRSGQSDSKYSYLLKRTAGALSSANTGTGYKITNKNSSNTDFGIIGCSGQYDSSNDKIYWAFVWEDTSNNTNAGVLQLEGDFSSTKTFTVGSNIITVAPETGTFNSSVNSQSTGGGASNNDYSTSTQTTAVSTTNIASNYSAA